MDRPMTKAVRIAEVFKTLAAVQSLFLRGFHPITESMKHGVKTIRLKRWVFLDVPACYDPAEKEICLDPNADVEHLSGILTRRHGIRVEPGEVHLWLFFHEVRHHQRRHLGRSLRDPWEEREAEAYAKRRFVEWKRGCR
jgi:hypothetical protein